MLEQLYEEQKLAEVSDEEIEAQKEHLMEEEKLLQRCEKKVSELVLACTRFQSQADVIAGQIRERFYRIERLPIAAGTIEIEKERQKELQQQCKRELAELFRKQKENWKSAGRNPDDDRKDYMGCRRVSHQRYVRQDTSRICYLRLERNRASDHEWMAEDESEKNSGRNCIWQGKGVV